MRLDVFVTMTEGFQIHPDCGVHAESKVTGPPMTKLIWCIG